MQEDSNLSEGNSAAPYIRSIVDDVVLSAKENMQPITKIVSILSYLTYNSLKSPYALIEFVSMVKASG